MEENNVRKSELLVVWFLEAKSARTLKIPEMCSTDGTAACRCWSLMANAQSMCAAILEELLRILYSHATAGRLSHHIATDSNLSDVLSTTYSNTNQLMKMPRSSKSEMRCPLLGWHWRQAGWRCWPAIGETKQLVGEFGFFQTRLRQHPI